jgi:hypothetical protein
VVELHAGVLSWVMALGYGVNDKDTEQKIRPEDI